MPHLDLMICFFYVFLVTYSLKNSNKNEKSFRKLEEMYLKANINSSVFDSSTILIKEGEAKISLNVSEKYFHALGAIHGTFISSY